MLGAARAGAQRPRPGQRRAPDPHGPWGCSGGTHENRPRRRVGEQHINLGGSGKSWETPSRVPLVFVLTAPGLLSLRQNPERAGAPQALLAVSLPVRIHARTPVSVPTET